MSSIIFRRFKSKGPEFKGQKLASEKSRGTDKTLKRHITVINVYSSIFKIPNLPNLRNIILNCWALSSMDNALPKVDSALSKIVNALEMQL